MILQDISFPNARENIACDEALLERAEAGSSEEILRFWEAERFSIVLGRISRPEEEIILEEARRDGVEIVRRASGGGTVLQGPGCLNYSLILSYDKNPRLKNIRESYEIILNKMCDCLKTLDINANFEPISDMALAGKKFSGNAQHRKKRFMLHHGTILHDFPIDAIEKYIRMPKNEPPYRKNRSHREFLTNISAAAIDIKDAIASGWIKDNVIVNCRRGEGLWAR